MNDQPHCQSDNYNLYRRILTNDTLQNRVRRKTNGLVDKPLQSLFAARLTPQKELNPPRSKPDDCDGNIGVTAFGFGLTVPCKWVGKFINKKDEINPVSPEATRYLETAFREAINTTHGFTDTYERQRHLRKSSPFGFQPLAYSKTGYDTFGYTFEPNWENQDQDGLVNDLHFRAFLSVETTGEEYLGVGGIFPDEGEQRISVDGNRTGSLEFDVKQMQTEVLEFMKNTVIS